MLDDVRRGRCYQKMKDDAHDREEWRRICQLTRRMVRNIKFVWKLMNDTD